MAEFTVEFNVEQRVISSGWQVYRLFIEGLRSQLGVRFLRNQPVLPPQQRTPTQWFDIILRTNFHSIELRIRRDSLYLDGYQTYNSGQWLEFGSDRTSPSHLITGSSFLGFDGGYFALERAAGQTREEIVLSRQQLIDNVNQLATSMEPRERAQSLIVINQMISESIRYDCISWHLTSTYIERPHLPEYYQPQPPPKWMWVLENAWGDLSAALLRADADPENRFLLPEPINVTGLTTMRNAVRSIGMLLDPYFTDSAAKDGQRPQGRPLVEVFLVRIDVDDIHRGLSQCNLYGTITVIDGLGLGPQYIYKRESDNPEPINPRNDVLLTGPARSISAYGSFTIEVALMDRDYEISKGQISWNVFNAANKYDNPLYEEVKGKYGRAIVNYMVLTDAVEATIEVTLIDGDNKDLANVYGLITACSGGFHETVLFHKTEDEYVRLCPGERTPLSRYLVAVPLNSSLRVWADLYDHERSYEIAKGTAEFPAKLSGIIEQNISGKYGKIQVKVTWDICYC